DRWHAPSVSCRPRTCERCHFPEPGVNRFGQRRTGLTRTTSKAKCEAANAVEALDPGVPYESRWAPYVRIHGPGQGQFPKGSIRPRGYMAPDARRSLAGTNLTTMRPNRQRRRANAPPFPADLIVERRIGGLMVRDAQRP